MHSSARYPDIVNCHIISIIIIITTTAVSTTTTYCYSCQCCGCRRWWPLYKRFMAVLVKKPRRCLLREYSGLKRSLTANGSRQFGHQLHTVHLNGGVWGRMNKCFWGRQLQLARPHIDWGPVGQLPPASPFTLLHVFHVNWDLLYIHCVQKQVAPYKHLQQL